MFNRELYICVFALGMACSVSACGPADDAERIGYEQTVRAQEPGCGSSCPDTCWVDISGSSSNRIGRWFIFDANELPETPLRNAYAHLFYTGGNWTKYVANDIHTPVQATVEAVYTIPSSFNVNASDLKAEIVMGSPQPVMTCGFKVL